MITLPRLAQLTEAGAAKVFSEKVSGASADGRRALARALAQLGPGDVLIVTRLDRLARSTRDLLNLLDAIAKSGAGFRSLTDAWADTTTLTAGSCLSFLAVLPNLNAS